MKKRILVCAMSALLLAINSWADDKEKDEDRLKNAGTVLIEILNIPDDIPQDLLDKADCLSLIHIFNTRLKSKGRALFYHTRQAFSDQWLALLAAEDFGKFRHVGNDVIDAILIQGMRI